MMMMMMMMMIIIIIIIIMDPKEAGWEEWTRLIWFRRGTGGTDF